MNVEPRYVLLYVLFIVAAALFKILISYKPRKRKRTRKVTPNKVAATRPTTSKKLTDEEIIQADINTLSGTDFEKLMAMYYRDKGYRVQIVGGSGDNEVDLILQGKEGYKIAVQCKRWKNDVGNDVVLRLKSGKQFHGCYDAWIVTTSHFTKAAREAADRLNIKLINGAQTQDMITRWRKTKRSVQ